ncbi:hypothetical protein Slin15195_G108610 [Septoria linicola]|uniref:Uncharacterized protein n=1 Tax=Septoria linicola TaxID=215465 RepID=A0A9Q9EPB9_9PEZI|nr:hypothetical protein Slin14017_G106910 [Septoria linicola]USW57542.1 hypothetical protein Slin15195_G108610 [Septoria linicola]
MATYKIVTNRVNFLDYLPAELKIIIFEFADGVPTARPIIAKGAFRKEHRELNNVGCRSYHWTVCKEFFIMAAKAYINVQTVQEHNTYNYYNQHAGKNLFAMPLFRVSDTLGHFQSLKKVQVDVLCSAFHKDRTWSKVLSEAEISKLSIAKAPAKIRGITIICCLPAGTPRNLEDNIAYIANLATLQSYLTSTVRQPKTTKTCARSPRAAGAEPLYLGSHVSGIDCPSKLLPKPRPANKFNVLSWDSDHEE